ncbi:MAG: TolC family protein, partial [Deltaproteobacteria bacterium]|nr:TolC family protein [Deltaproteobacteria bacterium]
MVYICLLLLVVGRLGFSDPGLAQQEVAGKKLTVEEAIEVALQNHPAIKEFRERSEAARSQIGISRSNLLPQVTNTSSYYYGTSVPTSSLSIPSGMGQFSASSSDVRDYVVHRFQVNQLLYDFGKTLGSIGQSKALYEASRMDLANIRQQVVLDAKTAFYGYLAAQRAVMVSEENLRLNEDLVRQAQGFYEVGVKAKIDVTTAEANLYTAQADLITARNTFQIAQVALMTALGLKSWSYVGLIYQLGTQPKLMDLPEAKERALTDRPDYLRNRFQQKADQEAVRVAKAGY